MAMFTGLGAAIAGMLGMAGPVTAGTAAAGGIYGATKAISSATKMPKASSSTGGADAATLISDATTRAKAASKSRKSAMTRTTYTSPLGLSGQADISKKTLLGE